MPTKKSRINVTLDDWLYAEVSAYQIKHNVSLSKAITDLVILGLQREKNFSTDTAPLPSHRLYDMQAIIDMLKAFDAASPNVQQYVFDVLQVSEPPADWKESVAAQIDKKIPGDKAEDSTG